MQALPANTLDAAETGAAPSRAALRAPAAPSTFADMRLKVGDQVYLEPPMAVAGGRATVTVLGWLEGTSLIVTAPQNAAGRLALQEDELVLLRAFTGTSAYAFRAAVLKTARQPFHHLHLSFPDKVEGVAVRNSPRCRLRLPARIGVEGRAPGEGSILNIGTTGALIESAEALECGQGLIQIGFAFELHGVPVSLELRAKVCGEKNIPAADATAPRQYGVEFAQMQPNDRLILGSLVWYRMYEYPRSVS